MRIEKDFEELLRLFNKNKARYCIVGAFAVAFHARPRYTKDLDILVASGIENGKKIVKSLNEFGFGSLNITAEDFCDKDKIVQLGYEPVRVDLITSLRGLPFKKVWSKKVAGKYGRQKVFFIGLDDLIRNKKLSKRKQDLIDLEILLSVRDSRHQR